MRYFNFAGGIEWIKYRIFNFTNIVGRELCEHILHGGTMREKMVHKKTHLPKWNNMSATS